MYFVRVLCNIIIISSSSSISTASFVFVSCSRDKYTVQTRAIENSARCLYVQLAGVNGVTGATAETTTYDRIFSTMKAMEAIITGKGITDPSKVTAIMLANAYRNVCHLILQQLVAPPIF